MTATRGARGIAGIPEQLDALSAFAATLTVKQLDADVVQTAKACLLYGLAVGIGTRNAKPAQLATAASQAAEAGIGTVTRLHDGAMTSLGNAVFANAVLLSGRVQGDSHICGHPGGVVIPSALAAVEQASGSGADLLASMVAGYEVALRIGRDHVADASRNGFRATPLYGVFGAATAIARARGCTAAQIRSAIGLAVNFAAGLREYVDAGTEESPFQAGFAARNGSHVAELVALGLEAAPSGLYGPAGFYQAYGRADRMDYGDRLADGLGQEFEFSNLTVKRYPACQFVRAVIRGLLELRSERQGSDAVRIVLRLHPYEANFVGMRFAGPFSTSAQTVMSAPFSAALAWVRGAVTFQGLRTFDDPFVNDLAGRVTVVADDTRALFEPVVTVVLSDGRTLAWSERADNEADRMCWGAATEMAFQLCDEVGVPTSLADDLIAKVHSIDASSSVAPLIASICRATQAPR